MSYAPEIETSARTGSYSSISASLPRSGGTHGGRRARPIVSGQVSWLMRPRLGPRVEWVSYCQGSRFAAGRCAQQWRPAQEPYAALAGTQGADTDARGL